MSKNKDSTRTPAVARLIRVASGKYRGRTLKSPRLSTTHPMGAREKLALFNIVNVEQARVLDAYAGSGALGIEALSRGAAEVDFVEKNPQACAVIRENLAEIKVGGKVFDESFQNFCERTEFAGYFEVVLADPPYDNFQPANFAKIAQILSDDGILALSSPAKSKPISLPEMRLSSTHTYARARISVYRKIRNC